MFNFGVSPKPQMNFLDPAYFSANRSGQVTEAQKRFLEARLNRRQTWLVLIFAGVFMLVLFVQAIVIGLTLNRVGNVNAAIIPLILSLIGLITLLMISLIVGKVWNNLRDSFRLKRDLQNAAIRQGQGLLAYGKKGYIFECAERTLSLSPETTGGLLPGVRYIVFYLEETGFLLSAETIGSPSAMACIAAIKEILAQANGYTVETLTANRNSEVTPEQRQQGLKTAGLRALLVIPVLLALSLFAMPIILSDIRVSQQSTLIFFIILAGILAIAAGIGLTQTILDMRDLPLTLRGIGKKHSEIRGSGKSRQTCYYYVIGDTRFSIAEKAYPALIDGLEYQAYYLPRSKRLLSIEPLSAPNSI